MSIKIEKSVPMNGRARNRQGARHAYLPLFRQMDVGDSFYLDGIVSGATIRNDMNTAGGVLGMHFSCRAESGGFRVWRIA